MQKQLLILNFSGNIADTMNATSGNAVRADRVAQSEEQQAFHSVA